jgi:hypothetical protein
MIGWWFGGCKLLAKFDDKIGVEVEKIDWKRDKVDRRMLETPHYLNQRRN